MNPKRMSAPSAQEINALVAAFNEQRYEAAQVQAKTLIKRYPKDSFGYKALGAVYTETQRSADSIDPMKKAIALDPRDAELRANLGNAYKDLCELEEAEKHYRKAIAIDPGFAAVYSNLGVVLKDRGLFNDAEANYRTSISLNPGNPETIVRLAYVLMRMGSHEESERLLRDVLKAHPDYVECLQTLALLLSQLERRDEAMECYQQVLKFSPDNFEVHNNHGNLFKDIGEFASAEAAYRKALTIKPDSSLAFNNLGMVLHNQNRIVEAEATYRISLALQPDFPEAINNLGVTLMETGRLAEAEALYLHALAKRPKQIALLANLGCVYKEQGRIEESVACFRAALKLNPDFFMAASNLLFTINYGVDCDPVKMLGEANDFAKACRSKVRSPYREWRPSSDGVLRIGFVSGDLYSHPVGYFLESLVKEIDQTQFALHAYNCSPVEDQITASLKPFFKKWQTITGLSDEALAESIHRDGIDILIDLSGHTANNRLPAFAYKPAPIQASWLGYFATTGMSEVDYWIGDPHVTPPEDAHHFKETLWPLADSYLCFTPPKAAPAVSALPALTNGYITYGCFNSLSKLNEGVIALWAQVLTRTPSSKLYLKTRQLDDQKVCESILASFKSHGIDESRLILSGWSPRNELLAEYSRVDFTLDPFPYPGGTTSAEALWMGVPVLTKVGDRFLSRIGKSIAVNAGLGDWVAKDEAEYVEKAVAFSADIPRLAALRASMRDQLIKNPLFDAKRFANNFADALKGMAHKLNEGKHHE
jgi:predicted O-linked N-acetylglucosamine transferase (SPINDLY family)